MARDIAIDVFSKGAQGQQFVSNKISSTKYNILTFLPKTMFLQCKNVVVCFFLFNGFLQSIPAISTNSPLASWIPVGWVIIMGIIFEGVTDIRRYSADKKVNQQQVTKLRHGASGKLEEEYCAAEALKVGDIVLLETNGFIPADCIILQAEDRLGQCYISTSNLDGERNLKPRFAPKMTQGRLMELSSSNITIQCIDPDKDIYRFDGKMIEGDQQNELGLLQFVPRGSVLRNSLNVYAMVAYTGVDTKLILNQGEYSLKISSVFTKLNKYLAINFLIMITFTTAMSQIGTRVWISQNLDNHYYIFPKEWVANEMDQPLYFFQTFLSFYLMFNMLIPLDLAITLLFAKMFYVLMIQADWAMYDVEKSHADRVLVGCEVKNLEILEDLSRITQIFCDKTGTLTKNELIFRGMAVGTSSFGHVSLSEEDQTDPDKSDRVFADSIKNHTQIDEQFLEFWRCLTLCHDVIQFQMNNKSKDDKLQFSGSSQDEITFLEMCRDVGFCSFIERDSNMITINIQGEEEKYQILRDIAFTSDRKKMSVTVKRQSDGKVVSYIKGADGFINLNQESDAESTYVKEKLNEFASMGLRTLMFCKKDLGSENDEASVREMEASELENDAVLLGITALEDLLQDNVKKCISDFRDAAIKVWMLTGDKGETAQSIGILCGLIDPELHIIEKIDAITKEGIMHRLNVIEQKIHNFVSVKSNQVGTDQQANSQIELVDIDTDTDPKKALKIIERTTSMRRSLKDTAGKKEFSLMISGAALNKICLEEELGQKIAGIFKAAASVIVYRSSPAEKAATINLVRKYDKSALTLAIGDGGNDINMIQSATVGIGIMGKEGNQAAQFSDYAIPNFQGLRRLLFWHGRDFGSRMPSYIALNLWKGSSFSSPLLFSNMYNGFSGYQMYMGFYNSLYSVMDTTFTNYAFLFVDQTCAFNFEDKYAPNLNKNKKAHTNANYDPVKQPQKLSIEALFNKKGYMDQMGISQNEDGSTNNLTDLYKFTRDYTMNRLDQYFIVSSIWCLCSGFIMFFFSYFFLGGAINDSGKINDHWNSGTCAMFVLITCHYVQIIIETKNFTPFNTSIYLASYLLYIPLTVWMCDTINDVYRKNQWSENYTQPMFYIVGCLQIFIICVPRYIHICFENIVWTPEFAKVKGD